MSDDPEEAHAVWGFSAFRLHPATWWLVYPGFLAGPLVLMIFVHLHLHVMVFVIIGALPSAVAYALLSPEFDRRTQESDERFDRNNIEGTADDVQFPRSNQSLLFRRPSDWSAARKRALMTAGTMIAISVVFDWATMRHIMGGPDDDL